MGESTNLSVLQVFKGEGTRGAPFTTGSAFYLITRPPVVRVAGQGTSWWVADPSGTNLSTLVFVYVAVDRVVK